MKSKLATYSAFAVSFLTFKNDTSAQVYYQEFSPPLEIDFSVGYEEFILDLDQDGVGDFKFRGTYIGTTSNNEKLVKIEPLAGNAVAEAITTDVCWGYYAPYTNSRMMAKAVYSGDTVSASLDWVPYIRGVLDYDYWAFSWCFNVFHIAPLWVTAYVPLRADLSSGLHYGWLRFEISAFPYRVELSGVALNAIPDTPLLIDGAIAECPAPSGLNTTLSGTSALLEWNPVSLASKYFLTGQSASAEYNQSTTATSKLANGLNPGATYSWEVRTYCTDGVISSPSPTESFTVPAPLTLAREGAVDFDAFYANGEIVTVFKFPETDSENGSSSEIELRVHDLSGAVLLKEVISPSSGLLRHAIEAGRLGNGIYLVSAYVDGELSKTEKVGIVSAGW